MEFKNIKPGDYVLIRHKDEVVVGAIKGLITENLIGVECDISAWPFVDWSNKGNLMTKIDDIVGTVSTDVVKEAHKRAEEAIRLAKKTGVFEQLSDRDQFVLTSVITRAFIG